MSAANVYTHTNSRSLGTLHGMFVNAQALTMHVSLVASQSSE